MDSSLRKHLHKCKLDEKQYKKLARIIEGMRDRSGSSDQLLERFTKKCYGQEKDRNLAKLQATTFLEALFGSVDKVMKEGPWDAVEILLKSEEGVQEASFVGDLIKVEVLKKEKSVNFSGQLFDNESEAKVADRPIWTKKLDKYLVGPTLGVGGTAKVKLAWNTEDEKYVALKILQPKYAVSAAKEIQILKGLNHENIIRVYDCYDNVEWKDKRTTVFALEYANRGELIEYLMYTSKFEDDLARWFFRSLTSGVEYCHKQNVIHRDLKHDNCLLGDKFVIKITDFGFAKHYDKHDGFMKTAIGTAQYAAPEILAGKQYDEKVDIFSMGVMLFITIAGSQPWRKADPKNDRWYRMVHNKKWDKFFDYHERSHKFTNEQKTILKKILDPNPTYRWSLDEIKRCKWYNGKTISQDEVESRLSKRKREVDLKKYEAMGPEDLREMRDGDIFSKKLPQEYFRPASWLSFVTTKRPEWVLGDIRRAIENKKGLKGNVTKVDVEKFKLTFQVKKIVKTGMYTTDAKTIEDQEKNKKKKVRIMKEVLVRGSVRMWLTPGQKRTFEERDKILDMLESGELTKKQKIALVKRIPPIKCYAVFMSKDSGETKFLLPKVYEDILTYLPNDIIAKETRLDSDYKDILKNLPSDIIAKETRLDSDYLDILKNPLNDIVAMDMDIDEIKSK